MSRATGHGLRHRSPTRRCPSSFRVVGPSDDLTRCCRVETALADTFDAMELDVNGLAPLWWLPTSFQSAPDSFPMPTTPAEVQPLRESTADLDARICALLEKVAAMPQQHIAVVGHSAFFKRMLRMPRKLANCGIAIVSLDDIAARNGMTLPRKRDTPAPINGSNKVAEENK